MTFMRDEIFEQPDIVARLAADLAPYRAAVAGARAAGVRFVLYAARGTSDNAAVFGKYLSTIHAGLPAGLAVPSSATVYDTPIDLRQCLVVGISQSGETPDVAEYVRPRAPGRRPHDRHHQRRRQPAGAPGRHRAGHARRPRTRRGRDQDLHEPARRAGAVLGDVVRRRGAARRSARPTCPSAMRAALSLDAEIAEIAQWLRFSERLLVTARGYNFATALEAALKFKETSYIAAMPYSAADLMHGPIAMVEPGYPALLFALSGRALPAMRQLERDLLRAPGRARGRRGHAGGRRQRQAARPAPAAGHARTAVAARGDRARPAPGAASRRGARLRPRQAARAEQGHEDAVNASGRPYGPPRSRGTSPAAGERERRLHSRLSPSALNQLRATC